MELLTIKVPARGSVPEPEPKQEPLASVPENAPLGTGAAKKKPPLALIAMIVVVVLIIAVGVALFLLKKRKQAKQKKAEESKESPIQFEEISKISPKVEQKSEPKPDLQGSSAFWSSLIVQHRNSTDCEDRSSR